MTRRGCLKCLAGLSGLGMVGPAGAAPPLDAAMRDLLGESQAVLSSELGIDLPELAEDGAQVPLTLSVAREDVEALFLLAEMNPTPLVASVELAADALPYLSARIRLNGDGFVYAVARCRAGWFYARRAVRVARGGVCA